MQEPMNEYDIGDAIDLRSYDVDAAGVAIAGSGFRQITTGLEADPTTVTFRMQEPKLSGDALPAEIVEVSVLPALNANVVKDAVARFRRRFTPTRAGVHWYGWEGDGVVETYRERAFLVRPRRA